MSGLEIVGVVLGALLLFISAAEHYRDGLGFVRRAIKKQAFIVQYRDELIAQRALLGLYIKEVLERTNLPASTQAELVETPNHDIWRRVDVVSELSKELGDAYHPFITLLTKICTILANQTKVAEVADGTVTKDDLIGKYSYTISPDLTSEKLLRLQELCIDAAKKEANTKTDPKGVWQRIKFSMKHRERDSILAELKDHNRTLEKFGSASNRAKAYERKQQMRKIHATFELRDETERLYRATCKACSCQPSQQQDVGLGLAVHDQSGRSRTDTCFQVYLLDANKKICVTSVKMVKATEPNGPPKKKVRLDLSKAQVAGSPADAMKRLHDICKESQLAQQSRVCLQLIVDEKGHLHGQLQALRSQKIATARKAILAVILAHSLPEVHDSSWWQSIWDSDSISFYGICPTATTTNPGPDLRIKLQSPFTLSTAADTAGTPSSSPGPAQVTRRNAHLHALGVVLLEIYLNRSLKADIDAQGFPNTIAGYRNVALGLLEDAAENDNLSAEWLGAMQFCLNPRPNPYSGSYSFEDAGFREMFYEEVVLALENHLMNKYKVCGPF